MGGFAYTLLCLLDFESSASFLQVNRNDILKLIFGVTSFIYTSLKREPFVLLMYLLGPSKSSEGLITPLLSLHHVPSHSLACCTWNVLQHFSHDYAVSLYLNDRSPSRTAKEGCMSVGSDGGRPRLEFWLLPLTNFILLSRLLKLCKRSVSSFLKRRQYSNKK